MAQQTQQPSDSSWVRQSVKKSVNNYTEQNVREVCLWFVWLEEKNIDQYIGMFHITKYRYQYQSKKSFIAQTLHKLIDQTWLNIVRFPVQEHP